MNENVELQPLPLIEDAETGDRFVLYATPKGFNLELRFQGGEPWATQKQMSDLFGLNQATISIHIANIFDEGEVDKEGNIDKINIASSTKPVAIYSLDVVLAVGFRGRSCRWRIHSGCRRAIGHDTNPKPDLRSFWCSCMGEPDRAAKVPGNLARSENGGLPCLTS